MQYGSVYFLQHDYFPVISHFAKLQTSLIGSNDCLLHETGRSVDYLFYIVGLSHALPCGSMDKYSMSIGLFLFLKMCLGLIHLLLSLQDV